MQWLTPAVLRLFERQYGLAARWQLRLHLSDDQIDARLQRGAFVRAARGVYRLRGGAVVPEQDPLSAQLRARNRCRVTGPFVLGLLGVEGFTVRAPYELLLDPRRELHNVPFRWRPDPTPATPTYEHGPFRLVAPVAALVDAARDASSVGARQLRSAYDTMRWRGLVTEHKLRRRMKSLGPDDPGVQFFLAFDEGRGLTPESAPERKMGDWLRGFDPAPEPQVWVTPSRRVDWYFRRYRLVLEYLGEVDHAYAAARLRDAERTTELQGIGVQILPVVAADLRERGAFVAYVHAALTVRAVELGVRPPSVAV